MNIDLITVGKTDSEEVAGLVAIYSRRIARWTKFSMLMLPDVKKSGRPSPVVQKKAEGEMLLRQFTPDDYVVLLDDKGVQYGSMEFAAWLQKRLAGGTGSKTCARRLCFVVGGPYGFSQAVYDRADDAVSLSRMTFSHQIIRAIFAEQLYRAFSILNNEPYHNE